MKILIAEEYSARSGRNCRTNQSDDSTKICVKKTVRLYRNITLVCGRNKQKRTEIVVFRPNYGVKGAKKDQIYHLAQRLL
jgi:hypothetical protein